MGELMCRERRPGFARRYDLPERVLPTDLNTADPGSVEANRYLLRRAIGALGVATAADAIDYFRLSKTDCPPLLSDLLENGDIVAMKVEGWKATAYALTSQLGGLAGDPCHRPTFLSPFDNLIWFRDRVERVFGFRYRIEIYVPQWRREFGYYVLPLLVDGDLVGRADLKLDRKTKALLVNALWLDRPLVEAAADALNALSLHLGAESIILGRVEPMELREAVVAHLA